MTIKIPTPIKMAVLSTFLSLTHVQGQSNSSEKAAFQNRMENVFNSLANPETGKIDIESGIKAALNNYKASGFDADARTDDFDSEVLIAYAENYGYTTFLKALLEDSGFEKEHVNCMISDGALDKEEFNQILFLWWNKMGNHPDNEKLIQIVEATKPTR